MITPAKKHSRNGNRTSAIRWAGFLRKNGHKVKINTKFNKIILAKDKFGSPTDYKLLVTSNFIIDNNEQKLSLELIEEFIYKNLEENYDQSNYENSIKKNLAEQISEKLRTKILTY